MHVVFQIDVDREKNEKFGRNSIAALNWCQLLRRKTYTLHMMKMDHYRKCRLIDPDVCIQCLMQWELK